MDAQRGLERRQGELVEPHGPAAGAHHPRPPPAPAIRPACGPPSNLSAEKQTTSQPAVMLRRTVARHETRWRPVRKRPSAPSRGRRSRYASLPSEDAELVDRRLLGEADGPEVRAVDPHQGHGVRTDRPLVVVSRVRLVVPTSTSRAPDCARRREFGTSRRSPRADRARSPPRRQCASAAIASRTAAALLFTAKPASAPVNSRYQPLEVRNGGSSLAALEVELEVR